MTNKTLISVVVPFYKGEAYIETCIKSIVEQPYKGIEILIINDGSPSGEDVCKHIEKEYSQVFYYYKENEGIGATRNYGLLLAKGDYIAFLDQDDVWARNFLNDETIMYMEGNDIIAFSYYSTNNRMTRGKKYTLNDAKIFGGGRKAVEQSWWHHSCMVFNRNFLIKNKIGYALTRHEDNIFVHKAVYSSKSIQNVDKISFLYRNNPHSETHRIQHSEKLFIPILRSWKELLEWHEEKHPDDSEIIAFVRHMICVYAIEGLEALYSEKRKESEQHRIARDYFEKYLDSYKEDLINAPWQVERVDQYFYNYNSFVKTYRKRGFINRVGKRAMQIALIKTIYDFKKYPEKLSNTICVR